MAHHFADDLPPRLLMWQRVREYAVPPSMIETAGERRAAGDWAGACAAARITVDLDLRLLRRRHGAELVTRLRKDLRRLAPDLLRWHMPRTAPDGRLRPGLTVCLARYAGHGGPPLYLVVRTPPPRADAGQWMSLTTWEGPGRDDSGHPPHPHPHPGRRFRLDLHRHLWDAARCGELARRSGAGRPPATVSADLTDHLPVHDTSWAVPMWAAEAEMLLRAEGQAARGAFAVRLGARSHAVLELAAPDDSHAPALRPPRQPLPPRRAATLPVLPEAAARTLPDLELLRAGLITPGRLHPLVAAALAPPGSVPGRAADGAPAPGDPHRVECRGEIHRIALRSGVLTAIDHDPAQLHREELLVTLGGPALPCLRAIDAVHRSPEALPAVRERLGHGDIAGALTVVEALLGPDAVLRDGPLRRELQSAAARRIDYGVFRAAPPDPHPAAGVSGGGKTPGEKDRDKSHRPRLDRRTPVHLRRKRDSRSRPRAGRIE